MHALSIIHELNFAEMMMMIVIMNVNSTIMSHSLGEKKTEIGKAHSHLTPKKKESAMAKLFV